MIPSDNEALLSRVSKAADSTDIAEKDMVLCQVESVLMGDPLATARAYTLEEMRAEQQMLEKQFAGRTSPKGSSVEDHTFAESFPSAEPVAPNADDLALADQIEQKISKPCGEFIMASLEGKRVIAALRAVSDASREALSPFASFGRDESGNDIRDGLMRDRICDWFRPSDFDAARQCFDKAGGDRAK